MLELFSGAFLTTAFIATNDPSRQNNKRDGSSRTGDIKQADAADNLNCKRKFRPKNRKIKDKKCPQKRDGNQRPDNIIKAEDLIRDCPVDIHPGADQGNKKANQRDTRQNR